MLLLPGALHSSTLAPQLGAPYAPHLAARQSALPAATTAALGGAVAPGAPPPMSKVPLDPVAERRRKRAEEELEKRLAALADGDDSSDED